LIPQGFGAAKPDRQRKRDRRLSAKPLRFWDLALYAVAMTLSLRWLSVAAAAGPASLPMWSRPGKQRCARQDGRCTGPRSPTGMASVAERMHEGRRAWVARTKAEGKPLTFAGFRPKGSGTPREVRQAAIAMRAAERERYSASKGAAETAKATVASPSPDRPRQGPSRLALSP